MRYTPIFLTSFQALMVSTASRVGTGNIIGVSTAICLGGLLEIVRSSVLYTADKLLSYKESKMLSKGQ